MIDNKSKLLLTEINNLCEGGKYKVLAFEELEKTLNGLLDGNALKQCLKLLFERDYILIKYEDDYEICLCPTSKGRIYIETIQVEKKNDLIISKQNFKFGFYGALLGTSVSILLFMIIYFIVRLF